MNDVIRYITIIFLCMMFVIIIKKIIAEFGINFVGIFKVLWEKFKDLWAQIKKYK